MMNIKYSTLLFIGGFLVGCGGASDDGAQETNNLETAVEAPAPSCTFALGESATNVYWTAYKHTDKIGVKGKMDSVVVTGTEIGSDPLSVLATGIIHIYTSSVNSKDEVRDKKLREIYFGSMANTEAIEGSLQSWAGSDSYGSCKLTLKMNDHEQEVSGKYTVSDNVVQIRFTMEPKNWGADEAITKLGEACAEKHTGKDGKTVFWPDVDLLVEVTLDKDCPDPA
ncbi:MAG: hypothetical protein JKX74_02505 [Flavobacteriales bacterium]|nr:hypothetical protein [Flavobacteriales bacterium]PCH85459.1 MAG: hypothetical protein COB88_09970 [Flavobacteriales bacterium]